MHLAKPILGDENEHKGDGAAVLAPEICRCHEIIEDMSTVGLASGSRNSSFDCGPVVATTGPLKPISVPTRMLEGAINIEENSLAKWKGTAEGLGMTERNSVRMTDSH